MKLPKSFRPEKNLENSLENLIKGKGYDPKVVHQLVEGYDEFNTKRQVSKPNFEERYKAALELASEFSYTKKDLEIAIGRMKEQGYATLGIYMSALVNNIIQKDDVISLFPHVRLTNFGCYMDKGTVHLYEEIGSHLGEEMTGGKIIVKGDVGDHTGFCMKGGKIIVEGNTGVSTGFGMENGEIIVQGNTGTSLGVNATGGIIRVYGEIGQIFPNAGVTVYLKNKKIHPQKTIWKDEF